MGLGNDLVVGQTRLTGAAQQLITDGSANGTSGMAIRAMSTNTGSVYVGEDNTVSDTTGYELSPGESITIELLNPSRLWVLGTLDERVCYMGLMP